MFVNTKLTILLGLTLCAKSFSEYNNDRPCYLQPLVTIANKALYFGTSFKGNFFDAHNFCRAHCMHLVSIESEEEHNGIVAYLEKSPYRGEYMWISGNDLGAEGDYRWLSTGQRIGFTKWYPGEPNNVIRNGIGENCLGLFSNYNWNDFTCTDQLFFICEIRQ